MFISFKSTSSPLQGPIHVILCICVLQLIFQVYALGTSDRYQSDEFLLRFVLSLASSLLGALLAFAWFSTFQRVLEIPSRIRVLVLELEFDTVEDVRCALVLSSCPGHVDVAGTVARYMPSYLL